MKKIAKVKEGDHILITGASGGVGSALLDIGMLENLKLYGTASLEKHEALKQFGAFLIDYKTQDFVEIIRKEIPKGLDFVFDGIGEGNIRKSYEVLRKGGILVEYGYSLKSFTYFVKTILSLLSGIPKGTKAKGYGISASHKMNKKPIQEDIIKLLGLLEEGKIHPLIFKRMPILKAAEANTLLESGKVTGNIVLVGE